MIGSFYIGKKTFKFIKNYVFGWDVTDLRNKENVVIRYLHKKYDEFTVLIILACIGGIFNIILGLFCGKIGEIISTIDILLSILSAYFIVKESEGV